MTGKVYAYIFLIYLQAIYPKLSTLKYDLTGVDSRTKEYYPESWRKSKKECPLLIGCKKSGRKASALASRI